MFGPNLLFRRRGPRENRTSGCAPEQVAVPTLRTAPVNAPGNITTAVISCEFSLVPAFPQARMRVLGERRATAHPQWQHLLLNAFIRSLTQFWRPRIFFCRIADSIIAIPISFPCFSEEQP
jgi:hypothetical protein